MFFLKLLLVIFAACGLALALAPKRHFLREGVRIPLWLRRLRSLPVGKYLETRHLYGSHPRQYLLFFQPENGVSDKCRVIVYLHGGGWQFGSPEMFRPNAQVLVSEGWRVFMPSHRRLPRHGCSHFREDLALMLRKIREVMQAEGLDGCRILLGGMSSGGHLAALAAFDASILRSAGLEREMLAGVFLLGAPLNLAGMRWSPPVRLLAGRRGGERFAQASPISHLQPNEPLPTLIVHGRDDGLVEHRSAEAFFEKMKSLGAADAQFVSLPNGVHTDAASWCFPKHPAREIVFVAG